MHVHTGCKITIKSTAIIEFPDGAGGFLPAMTHTAISTDHEINNLPDRFDTLVINTDAGFASSYSFGDQVQGKSIPIKVLFLHPY